MCHLKCFVFLTLLLFHAGQAFGTVYIDIDSPSFQKLPIAVASFFPSRTAGENGDLSVWFSDTLSRNLTITGYFNVLDRKTYPEEPKQEGTEPEKIRYESWAAIGAEYLVKGNFQMEARELATEFELFDVLHGESVVKKRYTGKFDDRHGMAIRFVNEILQLLTGEAGLFDTRIAFVRKINGTADIYTINFEGSDLRQITDYNSLTLSPRWSRDGRFIAFTSYRENNPELYIRDLINGSTRKLSYYKGLNLPGSWSLDGTRLLVTLSRDGNQEIYDMNVGNGLLQRLTRDFAIDVSPVRSPDEQRVAFVSNRDGSPQIYIMNANGGSVRRLTYTGTYNTSPAWSPKGRRIAYEGLVNGRFQIFIIDSEGGDPQQLTFDWADHESPSWSPDGRYLAYSVRGYGWSRIEIMNVGGQNTRVLYGGEDHCRSPFWSPHLP